ncbi:MAG: erythromycin esterase family protein [Gammaproteobacteria bacterium]
MNKELKSAYDHLVSVIAGESEPLLENADKYSSLIEKIGDSRIVLMGEATHGTEEFYQARIDISKRLIEEKGFMAIAIEGDWPDVYSLHRYVQGIGDVNNAEEALSAFKRFPTWMWCNKTMPDLLKWMRCFNDKCDQKNKVGFYGLDLYSFYASMKAVIDYLVKADPAAAERAIKRYGCFDHMLDDAQEYGFLTSEGLKKPCIKEAVMEIMELQKDALKYIKKDGLLAEEEYFFALQNAKIVKNAENYYRSMFDGHVLSWNNRDKHMAETVESILDHLEKRLNKPAKIIIWAHNSHVGDARATEMGFRGEFNIGQLVRERHDEEVYSIGFSTYDGTVTAATSWDMPGMVRNIKPGLAGSYEKLFHDIPYDNFLLELRGNKNLEHLLKIPRLQRAIGVIYSPGTERDSHYFYTQLPYQFDSIIHFDRTTAVKPCEKKEKK